MIDDRHMAWASLILLMAACAQGATFYADGAQTGTGHAGTALDAFSKADMLNPALVAAGSTVYCTGAFGDIEFNSTTSKGKGGTYTTLQNWPGQSEPAATEIYFDDDGFEAYLKIRHWNVIKTGDYDPVVAVVGSNTDKVSYVYFQDCNVGNTFCALDLSAGDFYPYYINTQAKSFVNGIVFAVDTDCNNWTIQDCNFMHGWRMMDLQGDNQIVTGCTFRRCGEDHLDYADGGSGLQIYDNEFTDTWSYYSVWYWSGTTASTWSSHEGQAVTQAGTGASGLYVGQANGHFYIVPDDSAHLPATGASTDDWILDSNNAITFDVNDTSTDNNQHCDHITISGDLSTNISICRNYFHTGGGQAVKVDLTGGIPDDVNICNNKFNWDRSSAYAVTITAGTNLSICNNTIMTVGGDAIIATGTVSLQLHNNILTKGTSGAGIATCSHNMWTASQTELDDDLEGANDQYSIDVNAVFTDYANQDYRLLSTSPARNAGTATYAPADDYAGATRQAPPDIGAYEYIAAVWVPPIGIPAPSFGIDETYRMYDDPNNRNGALTYQVNAEGGYFTHYVDYDDVNSTDTSNTYGSIAKPRDSIPSQDLPEGSVVEIHGNVKPFSWKWFSGLGTVAHPIFIRGPSTTNRAYIAYNSGNSACSIRMGGTYLILENIAGHWLSISTHDLYSGKQWKHLVVRGCDLYGNRALNGSVVVPGGADRYPEDFVIYNNKIHNNGLVPYNQGTDVHGIAVMDNALRTWIVDNEIYENDGDAIQVNACGGQCCSNNEWSRYTYIGRNIVHGDRENAIDLKDSEHVIISQNTIYGYTDDVQRVFGDDPNPRWECGSDGTAILGGNEGGRLTWIIYNEIYDGERAIRVDDECVHSTNYIVGNVIHDMNASAIITWDHHHLYMINNTFYDCNEGFLAYGTSTTDEASYSFVNNIFAGMTSYDIEVEYATGVEAMLDATPFNNNIFYRSGGGLKIRYASKVYTTLAAWQAGEPGQAANCTESNPLFTNGDANDFTLQAGSPAIDTASSASFESVAAYFEALYGVDIRTDFTGVADVRQPGQTPDMGAYEYEGGGTPDPNNHAPVLTAIGAKSVLENRVLTFTLAGTDEDLDSLTYSLYSLPPSGCSLVGTTFSWTPTYKQAGTYSITFAVSDGNGGWDYESVDVTVTNVKQYFLGR